ncbi:hypothetical protein HNO88_002978 [Novosphingobium chloroacetimidivorans]|uniref:Uncharacterized protein n=1 Tax=Novosphingobium chloroacetimidivorans TaxID=1428314 RepID=A0A7W7KB94_9SPHN|nr:hypothetical protein [Novosphingobium chloroacetimidivorans]MBB4859649.1 hypothetical protein [Novosphingobium chloroacetimidivorans]
MSGFIALHREATEHPLFAGSAERFGAWFWLVAKAVWKPTRFNVAGKTITLQRGQYCASVRELGEAWGWSKSSVDRFLTRLRTETMIVTDAGTGRLVITICNYEKYQTSEREAGTVTGTPAGTAAGQQRDIKEQGNKGTIEEETYVSPSSASATKPTKADPFPRPDWADAGVWRDLLVNRKAKRLPNTPTAHAKLLKDIMAMSDDEWPPGRLLEAIVARGWAAAYDPRVPANDRSTPARGGSSPAHLNVQRGPDLNEWERRAIEARLREGSGAPDRRDDREARADGELPLAPARALPGR